MGTLSLDTIVDVAIRVSPLAAARSTFNQALIVGESAVISLADRVRKYASTDDMLADGWAGTEPEYLAAQIYFSQDPAPQYVWVGMTDAGETPVQAIQACRAKNFEWYACMHVTAVTADHKEIAAYIETATPTSVYGFTTADAGVLNNVVDNLCEYLKDAGYKRTFGQYALTQPYAIAGIIGYAMGQNSGLANSAFTLKFKQEIGVTAEDLTPTQISNIEGNNCNLYLNYGNYYNIFEQGKMANGQFFDEIINLDMLANNIQLSVMDLLYGNPKVPQTDAGVNQIIHQINQACDQAVTIGFLGGGQWTGVPVLNLNTGDVLPLGYLVQASPLKSQSDADRQARKAPSIYVAIKEAGAVHSSLIGVYVSR
jgi:uncharacterized protein DUF3383